MPGVEFAQLQQHLCAQRGNRHGAGIHGLRRHALGKDDPVPLQQQMVIANLALALRDAETRIARLGQMLGPDQHLHPLDLDKDKVVGRHQHVAAVAQRPDRRATSRVRARRAASVNAVFARPAWSARRSS